MLHKVDSLQNGIQQYTAKALVSVDHEDMGFLQKICGTCIDLIALPDLGNVNKTPELQCRDPHCMRMLWVEKPYGIYVIPTLPKNGWNKL